MVFAFFFHVPVRKRSLRPPVRRPPGARVRRAPARKTRKEQFR
jgi:hypothetical protein